MKKMVHALLTIALAGGVSIFAGGSAQAALSDCRAGYACIWVNTDYSNNFTSNTGNVSNSYGTWVFNDTASSVAAYGNSCHLRVYADKNYSGAYIDFAKPGSSLTYRDPYLTNGGGYSGSTSANWNDRISSWKFINC